MNPQQQDVLSAAVPSSFLERLTEQLEKAANVKVIFGEPVVQNGTTVIPVARARWGAGRAGADPKARLGGGAVVSPVGFIEVTEGCATYKAIAGPAVTFAAVVGGAFLCLGLINAITQLASPKPAHRLFERRRGHR